MKQMISYGLGIKINIKRTLPMSNEVVVALEMA